MWNNTEIAMVVVSCLMFVVLIGVGMYESGKNSENKRLYEKCLMKSELVYSKAMDACKNEVK